jgi:poly(A) polymerase
METTTSNTEAVQSAVVCLLKKSAHVLRTIAASGHEGRLVGGCVRDALLGRASVDIDIAINVPPNEAARVFADAGFKVIPTGISHGTITIVADDERSCALSDSTTTDATSRASYDAATPASYFAATESPAGARTRSAFEITSLRQDVLTDGRHATVQYTDDWAQDAARRDFTINALYMDMHGNIYDYFTGQHDLSRGLVRFVGDAALRIQEDYLRILRYYRFLLRFGHEIDETSMRAVQAHVSGVKFLSKERVQSELLRILSEPAPMQVLRLMHDVLKMLFDKAPDINFVDEANDHILCAFPEFTSVKLTPLLRLYLLYSTSASLLRDKLRLSNQQLAYIKGMSAVAGLTVSESNLLKIRNEYGDNVASGWVDICASKSGQTLDPRLLSAIRQTFAVPPRTFPITGQDLLDMGIPPGKTVGHLLLECKEWWYKHAETLDREACLAFIKDYSQSHLLSRHDVLMKNF